MKSNINAFANSFGIFGFETISDDLSTQIDGVSQTFVTSTTFNTDSLVVYFNGVRQRTGVEITILNARTFTTQFLPVTGTTLVAVYLPL